MTLHSPNGIQNLVIKTPAFQVVIKQRIDCMISDDQTRILASMILCVPLSYVIPKIPSAQARQLYSFTLGTLIQLYIYGSEVWMVFLLHALCYLMVKANPARCGQQVTIISLVLLSLYHVYRMTVDYGGWTIDISTIMMSNVNKYSLFAYAVQDGQTQINKLSKQQIKERIQKIPSFFDFLSYCQFLPCSPISTAFPYTYYQQYIQLSHQYAHIPSPWKHVATDVGYSLILLLVYAANMFFFPLSVMKDPQFASKGFWHIVIFSFFCVTTLRFKYYFAWKLSMGSIHASGISYQVHGDKTSDFKLIQTCHPSIVETTIHVREKIAHWNMTCQEWLRKCVYERVYFKNKLYSQLITFMVSAFWHGFYGGYYLSFLLWFAQMFTSQLVFKQSKKERSPWVKIYRKSGVVGKIVVWVLSNVVFTVSGIFFQVLSLQQGIRILKGLYFMPVIFYGAVYVLFTVGATREPKEKKRVNDEKKHELHTAKSLFESTSTAQNTQKED